MERIKIKNFRKIQGTWELDLAPITFFTGTNNSGKSSVLKAIMALDDFGASNNHLELNFNGRNRRKHKIDGYTNAVNWNSQSSENLDMEFEFDHAGYEVFLSFTPLVWENQKLLRGGVKHLFFQRKRDGAKLSLERKSSFEYQFFAESAFFERRRKGEEGDAFLNQHNELRKMFIKEIRHLQAEKKTYQESDPRFIALNHDIASLNRKLLLTNKQIKEYKQKRDNLTFSPTVHLNDIIGEDFTIDRLIRNTFSRYFRNKEKDLGLSDSREDFHRAVLLGDRLQEALNFQVEHLSPHRNNQIRLYVNDETSTDIYDIINAHSLNPIPKGSKASKFIKKWMEAFDVGKDYKIIPVEGVASIIQITDGGKQINLVDKGFGAGQVFTIILRIAMMIHRNNPSQNYHIARRFFTPIILIEEPEANLHPAFQSKMVDLFREAFELYGIRFIIETHSEYILRQSQVSVKTEGNYIKRQKRFSYKNDSELKEELFAVYYFDKDKGPYKMNYDEEGKFIEDFGEGFFDVSRKLTRKLL